MPTYSKTTPPKDWRGALIWELHALLDLPLTKNRQPTKGCLILNSIAKAMTEALRRGESIEILGFGRFLVVNKRRMFKRGYILCGTPLVLSDTPMKHPDQKKVIFIPSPSLLATMNPHAPTGKQVRQLKNWAPKPA